MKQLYLTIIILLLVENANSQTNNPRISPVHSGTFSNSRLTYVVGKIYVLPIPVEEKQTTVVEEKRTTVVEEYINIIKIYPNPVTSILNIENKDNSEINFIAISDMNGKLIYSNKLEQNSIDLSFLNQGFYIIKLDNDTTKTFKIIKK